MRPRPAVIAAAGVNHRTAPVEERELLAFGPQELPAALSRLRQELGAAVLLSTCNRTELYTTLPVENDPDRLPSLLMELKGVHLDRSRFYVLRHEEAVRHLYRVAAGLDSMIVGEAQIQGQVREAFSAATEANCVNGILSRLFHTALTVGKRARSETGIGRWARSVGSAAVSLAWQALGGLGGRTILVISAGSMGKLTARALRQAGASRVLVANRTYERAVAVASSLGGEAIPFARLPEGLLESDIVISATGAEGFVLGPEEVALAMTGRAGRPLLIIDLAVPRDIHPAVGEIPGVHLYDIDDLRTVCLNGEGRRQELQRAEAIVEEELGRFREWWRSLDVAPLIAAIHQWAEEIRRCELEKTLRRLPGLTPEERRRLDALTAAIVNKILHQPISRLKDGADIALYRETLADLFGLEDSRPGK